MKIKRSGILGTIIYGIFASVPLILSYQNLTADSHRECINPVYVTARPPDSPGYQCVDEEYELVPGPDYGAAMLWLIIGGFALRLTYDQLVDTDTDWKAEPSDPAYRMPGEIWWTTYRWKDGKRISSHRLFHTKEEADAFAQAQSDPI